MSKFQEYNPADFAMPVNLTAETAELPGLPLTNMEAEHAADAQVLVEADKPVAASEESPRFVGRHWRKKITAVGAIAASAASIYISPVVSKNNSNMPAQGSRTSGTIVPNVRLDSGNIKLVSHDEELSAGGFNCGETHPKLGENGATDFSSQIDYLNSKQNLTANVEDFTVNDPTFGVGAEAFDYALKNSIANPNTPASATINGSDNMDTFMHNTWTHTLTEPLVAVNTTCDDGHGHVTKVHTVGLMKMAKGMNVNGLKMTDANASKFTELAKKNDDGKISIIIKPLGTEMIDGKEQKVSMLVFSAFGCDNPIRAYYPPTSETPPPPTSIVTPTPRPTPTPTPYLPIKHDDGKGHGGADVGRKGDGGTGQAGNGHNDNPIDGFEPGITPVPHPTFNPTPTPDNSGREVGAPVPPLPPTPFVPVQGTPDPDKPPIVPNR